MSPVKKGGRFLVPLAILLGSSWPVVPAHTAPSRVTGERILFMGTRDGNADVFVGSAGSTNARRVVSNPGHDCGPALMSRSRELVYSSMRLDGSYEPGGYFQLYKLDLVTRKTKRLTTSPGHNFGATISPDGKHIAFASTRNGALGAPNWPVSSGSIFVMDADGSHVRQITDADSSSTHNFPAWSPHGDWIAFQVTRKTEPLRPSIYAVRPNGEGMHILQYDGLYPAWSPDGKRIAFNRGREGAPHEQDLHVMDADGSDARRLSNDAGAEYMPSWAPDGKHLAYVHDPDGWTDVAAVTLLPDGRTLDTYSSGPEPSSIWVADLGVRNGKIEILRRHQRTMGGDDLFPRFAPAWLR